MVGRIRCASPVSHIAGGELERMAGLEPAVFSLGS